MNGGRDDTRYLGRRLIRVSRGLTILKDEISPDSSPSGRGNRRYGGCYLGDAGLLSGGHWG